MKLHELTIEKTSELLHKKEISSRELVSAYLERIESVDSKIGAYIAVAKETALEKADSSDKAIRDGSHLPLIGIPIAVKDIVCTKGLKTTCASKILADFVPPYNATVIEKLHAQGAILLGKTNMDEFAMGSSTENSAFKLTRNPWDMNRIPGGSSGGSAACIAADMAAGALGSDTGGSIRQPASHCGVVGMKPTYGRVSRFGLVAYASSLDQIGPFAKSVKDCAILMNAISGYDPNDSTSVQKSVPDYTAALIHGLKGIRIGLPREYLAAEGLHPDVKNSMENAVKVFERMGAELFEIPLPHTRYVVAVYYVIAPCEASSNLARYDGVKYGFRYKNSQDLIEMYRSTRSQGFGAEVQRRIIIGTYCLSAGYYDAYYGKASQVRTLIMQDFKTAFESCDVILSPVAPTPAYPIGENSDDPLTMYLSDIFTLSANLAGIPAISVPCGFSKEGLPIGLQLMSNHFNEEMLLKVAYNFEQATNFHQQKPNLAV